MPSKPQVVLVHGALSDASIWREVITQLQAQGHDVAAPPVGLRSLSSDVADLNAYLDTVQAPIILVGHSYGGSIISHSDLQTDRVRGLIYISAFQPDAGESTGELNGRWPGSKLGESTTLVRNTPHGPELYLRPESFADVYAGDLPEAQIAVLAASQRPLNPEALEETFDGTATWNTLPSWTLISTADNSLPPEAQRAMAARAGSETLEVPASHASPLSQPHAVTDLIGRALAR